MRSSSRSQGFTLIELMLIVVIMGILAAAASVAFKTAARKTRDSRRKGDIAALRAALELYFISNNQYPASETAGALAPNGAWAVSNDASWNVLATALKPYMDRLPKDPMRNTSGQWSQTDFGYGYASLSPAYGPGYGCPGKWYVITYTLEDGTSGPGIRLCDGTPLNYAGTHTDGELKG